MTRLSLWRRRRLLIAFGLVACLALGAIVAIDLRNRAERLRLVAYFEESNGVYVGDDVLILGVRVGTIDAIEPQPTRTRITFSVDGGHKVPADARAVIINPTLVTARAIQLTPAYTGGPAMTTGTVIPQDRTAVPVEYDDLREQLEKLTEALQPTEAGGVSTLGAFVNTAADNFRGQGSAIRSAIIELSKTFSALGDHSGDLFGSIRNLSLLTTGLQSSSDLLRQLNLNLDAVSGLLAKDPEAIENAIETLNTAVRDVERFVNENRKPVGTTFDRLASISKALGDSIGDLKQTLHITPTAFANFVNIYEPSNGALTGVAAVGNFANPIQFICAAIQAASRMNSDQSAKLCVQYLAPIVKNRQFNFPPLGFNPFVGAQARPNEVTFSEDWLAPLTEAGRVRGLTGPPPPGGAPPTAAMANPAAQVLPAEAPHADAPAPTAAPVGAPHRSVSTDPSAGLAGLMTPGGATR
ncbi:MCE family protein [Mycolicibacterium elephantis]